MLTQNRLALKHSVCHLVFLYILLIILFQFLKPNWCTELVISTVISIFVEMEEITKLKCHALLLKNDEMKIISSYKLTMQQMSSFICFGKMPNSWHVPIQKKGKQKLDQELLNTQFKPGRNAIKVVVFQGSPSPLDSSYLKSFSHVNMLFLPLFVSTYSISPHNTYARFSATLNKATNH